MNSQQIPLFTRQRPYYIVAADYTPKDSQARSMHQLCHALNLLGAEAYVLAGHVSPILRTPLLTAKIEHSHLEAGLQPIVVYPDNICGNPLTASTVARYAYRRPVTAEDSVDCVFAADYAFLTESEKSVQLLQIPLADGSKCCPGGARGSKWLAYTGDYPDARHHFAGLLKDCEIIDESHPATQEKLIELLQTADRFYCFGES